jgi:hypothetical protein
LLYIEENFQQAGRHTFGILTTAEHPRRRPNSQHWQACGGIVPLDHGLERIYSGFIPIARNQDERDRFELS